jgi:large subunit ribosomal protein L22
MDVHARLRNLRMAPRKVRLVIDLIRGKAVNQAITELTFLRRDAALPVLKLLKSAMANAEHNFKLDTATLRVKTVTADGGATIKRFRPRAHGSAAPIRKRTTHINLVLSDEAAVPSKRELRKAELRAARKPRAKKAVAKKAAPKAEPVVAEASTETTN